MSILVAGGAGYIGSHMTRLLKANRLHPVVFDNLSTGHKELVPKGVPFVKGDLRNPADSARVFKKYKINAVMHFAASALVGESMQKPILYYENNVVSCVNLVKAMLDFKVKHLIFSSTCAVYGQPKSLPIKEDAETHPTNTYGRTKLIIEEFLSDVSRSHAFRYVALRYFNAAGAHERAETGEWHAVEAHLIPNVLKSLTGEKKELIIFGGDYPTKDGTCVRDYIHVEDLCRAHLLALKYLKKGKPSQAFNLGIEEGYSVKEIIKAAEKVTGRRVVYKMGARRSGDPAKLVACADKAKKALGWKANIDLKGIMKTAWQWEIKSKSFRGVST